MVIGVEDTTKTKRDMRTAMRAVRRAVPDVSIRSKRIWEQVETLPAFIKANTVMVFTSIVGEPDTGQFIECLGASGRKVVLPEDEPAPDPAVIDLIVVPGLAFTIAGDRLGQGGGWYDRFLVEVDCPTVGVCFSEQLVGDVPTESHDIGVDRVIFA